MKKVLVTALLACLFCGVCLFGISQSAPVQAASASQVVSVQAHPLDPHVCPPTLLEGSRGYWVKVLQYHMVQAGIRDFRGRLLTIDGVYGGYTVYVVAVYQMIHGLHIDGRTGLQTWHSLGLC